MPLLDTCLDVWTRQGLLHDFKRSKAVFMFKFEVPPCLLGFQPNGHEGVYKRVPASPVPVLQ